jgi:hypothetical protein
VITYILSLLCWESSVDDKGEDMLLEYGTTLGNCHVASRSHDIVGMWSAIDVLEW